jgi:hypothetical protein
MPAWRTCLEKVPNHLQGIKVAACFPDECLAQHSPATYTGHSVTAALDQVILNPHAIPSGRPAVDYGNSSIVRVNVRELLNFGLSVDAVGGQGISSAFHPLQLRDHDGQNQR